MVREWVGQGSGSGEKVKKRGKYKPNITNIIGRWGMAVFRGLGGFWYSCPTFTLPSDRLMTGVLPTAENPMNQLRMW